MDQIRAAEQQARTASRGLWSSCASTGASAGTAAPTTVTDPAVSPATPQGASSPASPPAQVFRNCAELNAVYPGGVARSGVTGNTVSGQLLPFGVQPVFDDALYAANTARDADKDGIACEQ